MGNFSNKFHVSDGIAYYIIDSMFLLFIAEPLYFREPYYREFKSQEMIPINKDNKMYALVVQIIYKFHLEKRCFYTKLEPHIKTKSPTF